AGSVAVLDAAPASVCLAKPDRRRHLMAANRHPRSHRPPRRPAQRSRLGPCRGAVVATLAVLASLVGLIAMTAPAFASTGSVYFDAFNDVGAGAGPFFNASTTGPDNVGLGFSVMPNLAVPCCNVAIVNETLLTE